MERTHPLCTAETLSLYTAEITPDSQKYVEAFGFLKGWLVEKVTRAGHRIASAKGRTSIPGGIKRRSYTSILFGLEQGMRYKAGVELRIYMDRDKVHFFGAWNRDGWLQGLAFINRNPSCPVSFSEWPCNTLKIVQLCAGVGRFVEDEPTPLQGTGTSLIRHIAVWAKGYSFKSIVLESTLGAIPFYEKLGFEVRREWPLTTDGAERWMELPCSKWGLIESEKYNHCQCDVRRLPTIVDWQKVWREMGPPLWAYVNGESGTGFADSILKLPIFDPNFVLDHEGQTVAHYILASSSSKFKQVNRLFEKLRPEQMNSVWYCSEKDEHQTIFDCWNGRVVNNDPKAWNDFIDGLYKDGFKPYRELPKGEGVEKERKVI